MITYVLFAGGQRQQVEQGGSGTRHLLGSPAPAPPRGGGGGRELRAGPVPGERAVQRRGGAGGPPLQVHSLQQRQLRPNHRPA